MKTKLYPTRLRSGIILVKGYKVKDTNFFIYNSMQLGQYSNRWTGELKPREWYIIDQDTGISILRPNVHIRTRKEAEIYAKTDGKIILSDFKENNPISYSANMADFQLLCSQFTQSNITTPEV